MTVASSKFKFLKVWRSTTAKKSRGDDDNKQLEKILASERCNKHCNEPNSTIYERAVIESCRCGGRAQDTVIPRMQQVDDDGVVAVMC